MVDIVLIRNRILTERLEGQVGKTGGQRYPPWGILYIKSYLRKFGYTAKIMDRYDDQYIDQSPDKFVLSVHAEEPRFIGFSALTSQSPDAEQIAKCSKSKYPEVPIILGGVHYSSLPEIGLEFADYVVKGDGEIATLEILNGEHSPGLVNGKLVNVDEVPFPNLNDFNETGFRPKLASNLSLLTARGCPFDCYFCKDGVRGSVVRHHSPEYVGNMFESMLNYYPFHNTFFVMDDIFIPNEERLHAYIEEFSKRKINPNLEIFFHPNTIAEKLLPLCKKLGVKKISLGIESGSQKILDEMGKKTKKETITKKVNLLRSYDLEVNGLLIIGHRGETKDTMQETLDFAEQLDLNSAWFSYLVPFPGTPLWNEGVENHGKILDWNMAEWGNVNPVFLPKDMELEDLISGMERAQLIRKKLFVQDLIRKKLVAQEGMM